MADHDEAGEAYQAGGANHFRGGDLGPRTGVALGKLRRTASAIVDEMQTELSRRDQQARGEIARAPEHASLFPYVDHGNLAAMQDLRSGIDNATGRGK